MGGTNGKDPRNSLVQIVVAKLILPFSIAVIGSFYLIFFPRLFIFECSKLLS